MTIIELLVVIAILAILAAVLVSAVQQARESARRAQCINNLKQIGIALAAYQELYRAYPPGTGGLEFSQFTSLLPYLEQSTVHSIVDLSQRSYAIQNDTAAYTELAVYRCPDDGQALYLGACNYAGNYGSGVQQYGFNGIIRGPGGYSLIGEPPEGNYAIRAANVTDGLSDTAAFSEILTGNGRFDPLRSLISPPISLAAPAQLDAFAGVCKVLQPSLGPPPSMNSMRGEHWLYGGQPYTGYNHVLTPNQHSCFNGTFPELGAYSATSLHPRGVNVLFADTHQRFVHESIDVHVWRALGSRNGNEAVSLLD